MKKFTFLVAALCATMMAFAAATAVKVTDASTLKAGDKIVIANLDGSQAMSTSQTTVEGKSYYRGVVDFDVKNVTTDVEQVELVASGSNFKLKVTGGYLYFDSSWEKNWLGTNATGTDFTFEASGDTLRLKEVASGRYIMYNTQSDPYRFSCYKASSGARKNGGTSIYTISGGSEGGEEGGGSEGGETEETVVENKTIAEFIANKGGKCYLTGAVGEIKNTTFGNFYLTDASGTIFVYGCLTADGQSKQFETLGVAQGDTLTVLASVYEVYQSQDQAKDVIYVSHKKATAIRTVEIDNTVYARDGRIYAEEGARIYSLTGLDVTRMNGNLEGIYIVKNGNKVAKVAVAK